jgi:hypothetical protein
METQNKILKIAALSFALFSLGTINAQNDTVKVYQREVVHDTVVKDRVNQRPALRKGEFGIRYMPTFGALALTSSNGSVIQGDVTMSNGFGIMLAHNFNRHVGIQAEVNYYDMQQKYKDQALDRTVNLAYLNIPVMLSLNTDKSRAVNWNFVAGPQFALNVGSSLNSSGNSNNETVQGTVAAKAGDIGLAYGTGLEFMLNKMHTVRLDLGYRGFYGFVDMKVNQTSANTYNVLAKGTRKTNGGYLGLSFLF